MKKLVCVMAVLAAAGLAMASPAFVLPGVINIDPGETLTVTLGSANLTDNTVVGGPYNGLSGVQGINLFLMLRPAAGLTLGDLNLSGVGLAFNGNAQGTVDGAAAVVDPGTLSGTVSAVSHLVQSGNLATFTISAVGAAPNTNSTLLTSFDDPDYGLLTSDFSGVSAVQASSLIHVTPEPVSALLLLAGLPLLRRRHA